VKAVAPSDAKAYCVKPETEGHAAAYCVRPVAAPMPQRIA